MPAKIDIGLEKIIRLMYAVTSIGYYIVVFPRGKDYTIK